MLVTIEMRLDFFILQSVYFYFIPLRADICHDVRQNEVLVFLT